MSDLLPAGVRLSNAAKLYIDGRWQAPRADGRIDVVSPDTEDIVARVAEAREADMDLAVASARAAFDRGPWPRMSVAERGGYLKRMGEYLAPRVPELAEALRASIGALPPLAAAMAGGAAQSFAGHAELGLVYPWISKQASTEPGYETMIVREPVGVVAAIAPWNSPFAIMVNKVAPALICGCTVVMKPSPETPLDAYFIAEAAEAAGLPPGVVNLVPSHREAADYLVRNPGVDKITFTGSTAAGRRIASVAGERIARVTLELGGKSPAVILDDYPVEAAGAQLARTITVMTGQVCAMLSRVIVPAHRQNELSEAIAAEMKRVKVGHSDDPSTEMGPLAMRRQLDRVEGYIARATADGAKLVTGGGRPSHLNKGVFIEPTLFADVDNSSQLAQEEVFGPVLALIPARDEAHAFELANETSYGLNAAIFTNDTERFTALARGIRSGTVVQNGMVLDFAAPFGGFKQSGLGREGGVEGVAPYTETKTVLVKQAAH
ncbi:MAG: aldehyde dehydrogenase [Hydrogenophilaceae bacterium]|jgi:acyl-CoA reductase-like NAD-dependent aldehyde dehydrogenase|nr:aldehyde dehydrogenase [Hydrogenophilaceae bacterium]